MFENNVLNNILKPHSPHWIFLMAVLTPRDYFFVNISLNMYFWEKSFKQKLFLINFPID